jgi:hypothetical protein
LFTVLLVLSSVAISAAGVYQVAQQLGGLIP